MRPNTIQLKNLLIIVVSLGLFSFVQAADETEFALVKKCLQAIEDANNADGINDPGGKKELFIIDKTKKQTMNGEKKGFAVIMDNRLLFCPTDKPVDKPEIKAFHPDIENSVAILTDTDKGAEFVYNPHNSSGYPSGDYNIKDKCTDSLQPGDEFEADVGKKTAAMYKKHLEALANALEGNGSDKEAILAKIRMLQEAKCKELAGIAEYENDIQEIIARVDSMNIDSTSNQRIADHVEGQGGGGQGSIRQGQHQ